MRSMNILLERFGLRARPPKPMIAVDVEALIRENLSLHCEVTELRCKLGAGGRTSHAKQRAKYLETARKLGESVGFALPTPAGQARDISKTIERLKAK